MSTNPLELEENPLEDVNSESYTPIIVVCNSCGIVYEYVRANESCPVCGSADHITLFVSFSLGGPVMYEKREVER